MSAGISRGSRPVGKFSARIAAGFKTDQGKLETSKAASLQNVGIPPHFFQQPARYRCPQMSALSGQFPLAEIGRRAAFIKFDEIETRPTSPVPLSQARLLKQYGEALTGHVAPAGL